MPAVAVLAVRALAALWAPLAAVMMAVPAIIIGLNIHTLHSPMRASTRSERGSSSSQQQQHTQTNKTNPTSTNKQQQSKRNVSFKTEHKAKRKFSLARVFKRLNEIQNNLNKNNINNYTSCLITITTKTTTK